jgi:hypothetical protein
MGQAWSYAALTSHFSTLACSMDVTGVLPAVYMNTWKEPPTTVPQRCAKKQGGG